MEDSAFAPLQLRIAQCAFIFLSRPAATRAYSLLKSLSLLTAEALLAVEPNSRAAFMALFRALFARRPVSRHADVEGFISDILGLYAG